MPVSIRYGIDYPLGTEAPDIDGDILKVVTGIENLAAQFGQGTLVSRPVSTPGSPGKQGRFYVVTSGAELGQVHYDYGTGWIHINPDQTPGANSITSAMIQDNAVGSTEIAADAVGDSELADNVVSPLHLVNALKPSTGAGAATEALRSIGSGAGQVVAGSDARLTDTRTPTDLSVTTAKIVDDAVTAPKIAAGAVGASEIADDTVGVAELATVLKFNATPPVCTYDVSLGNGQTYTITAPAAGTYIHGFGAGVFSGAGQGASGSISSNKGGQVNYGNVGDSAGCVFRVVSCTAGEVITMTASVVGSFSNAWATLQRIS